MDGKKKRKAYDYIEGHKRETRKSYQSFIEKEFSSKAGKDATKFDSRPTAAAPALSPDSLKKISLESEREMTDRVRKSSRTPVPKKSFDLVDKFETLKAKEHKEQSLKPTFSQGSNSPNWAKESAGNAEKSESDSDHLSRKSQRTPVPKKTFDLIDSGYSRVRNKQQNAEETNSDGHLLKKNIKKEPVEAETPKEDDKSSKGGMKKGKKDASGAGDKSKMTPAQRLSLKIKEIESSESAASAVQDTATSKDQNKGIKEVKTKKDGKGNRKRKQEEMSVAEDDMATKKQDGPREKAPKTQNENLDEMVLMEALQALNPEPKENVGVAEMVEGKGKEMKEKKGRRSTKKMMAAKSLHKTVRIRQEEKADEVKVKEEQVDFDDAGFDSREQGLEGGNEYETRESWSQETQEFDVQEGGSQSDMSCSTSVTERSDGHIILKLGGLNSPTKVKKHKKKHKHKHHKHHDARKEIQEPTVMSDHDVVFSENISKENEVYILKEPEPYDIASSYVESAVSKTRQTEEQRHKKSKKRKRSLSAEVVKERATSDASIDTEELIVKKRKIYKKKKGVKTLVRIQTEYWSQSGVLVKVEPSDDKGKSGDVVKEKSSKVKVNQAKKNDVKNKAMQSKKKQSGGMHTKNIVTATQHGRLSGNADKSLKDAYGKDKGIDHLTGTPSLAKRKPKPKLKSSPDGGHSSESSPMKKKKERKTQTLTAYLLYCRKYRPKVVSEHPEMGFCEISKKLAKMWGEASEKEKDIYKKQLEEHRAKINATKRKQSSKLKTTKQAGPVTPEKDSLGFPSTSKRSSKEYQIAPQKYSVSNVEPIDMAAHLQLLGESLTLVATALRRQGDMKVHGALSVLLDSCLCSMAPLLFLTSSIPQIDVIPAETKANILDNVAYILPGL